MKSVPLYKQIQHDIKKLIQDGVLRSGDRVPSEKELAAKYNVSQMTSKNALIGLVEEGYLVRIQGKGTFVKGEAVHDAAIEELQHTSRRADAVVGLILPTMKTVVDQRYFDSIEKYAREAGFDLMVRITRESQEEETQAIENFLEKGVKGLIIFPVRNPNYNDAILRLWLDKTPLVLIDRYLDGIQTYSVSSENINGTCGAISDLLERGHRSIALISPEITNTVTAGRLKGFEQAFLEQNVFLDKNLWCLLNLQTISDGKAYDHILEFLQDRPEISAVFTVNTALARSTYAALKKLSRSVPKEVELVTFDPPGLDNVSFIEQDEDEMCRVTMNLLVEQMKGTFEPRRVEVPVKYRRMTDDN